MIWKIIMALALALFIILIMIVSAHSHSWYPTKCCSGRDCFRAEEGMVVKTPNGFLLRKGLASQDGFALQRDTLIPYGDKRIHSYPITAPDDEHGYHPCLGPTQDDGVLCLFVPRNSGS